MSPLRGIVDYVRQTGAVGHEGAMNVAPRGIVDNVGRLEGWRGWV